MQFLNGQFVTDEERYSGPTRVYLINLETGDYSLLQTFDDVEEGNEFCRQTKTEYPMMVWVTNDTLVPVNQAVASLCSWVKTGNR